MNAEIKRGKLAEFFQKEYGKLVAYVRKSINDTADRDAEDVVQDVILNIFDRADLTIPIENLAAYIYRSLKNRIIDIFRKKQNLVSYEELNNDSNRFELAMLMTNFTTNDVPKAEEKELVGYLYHAIESLTPNERAVIIATEFEGISFRNLSEIWGIPIGTLLNRKSRALTKIREKFNFWFNPKKEDKNGKK
jgi:RNA polymerase sigma-70 factor (ECF subfamily)